MDMDISNHNEKSRKSRKYLCRMTQIQGVEKVDTLSSKAHFIQAFDESTEV